MPNSACAAVAPSATTTCGCHDADFGLEPRKAGLDFDRARFAVNAPRAARHPFEVLDDIRDVGLRAVDSRLDKAAVEQFARRPDKRVAGEVFGIARLLADQHDPRLLRALPEHGLCGVLVQIAVRAAGGGVPQRRNARLYRDVGLASRLSRRCLHLSCPARKRMTE